MKYKIQPINGDASFREFYRLTSSKNSKIIVLSKKEKYKNLIAYSAINKFLRNNKILAPKLYNYDYSKGIIIIEDFGDILFYKEILKKKDKLLVYKKIINLLLKIQKIKPKSKIQNITGKFHKINKYSTKYLHKESDLFFEWYLPLFLNKKKIIKIKKRIKKILSKLYRKLDFSYNVFVHRDYHSQNLVKVGNRIGILDSQDALLGNPAYDLASLIDDVRIRTSKNVKNDVYNYYLNKAKKIIPIEDEKFLRDFKILSVQRNLKILGIFSRLFKRDKKNSYLKFMPYIWELLEMRMDSAIFLDLKEILDINIPKKLRKKSY